MIFNLPTTTILSNPVKNDFIHFIISNLSNTELINFKNIYYEASAGSA